MINDPLAVAYFLDRSLCGGIRAYTQVETGGLSAGQTIVDAAGFYRREPNALILTETNPPRFFKLFLSRVLKIGERELEWLDFLPAVSRGFGIPQMGGEFGQ